MQDENGVRPVPGTKATLLAPEGPRHVAVGASARAHGNRIAVRVFSPEGAIWELRLVARSPGESTPPLQGSQGYTGLIPVASRYVARYTYRVAISNPRIESIERDGHHGRVTFCYKDHRHHQVWRRTRLPGVEFLRRFCAHVLPRGFVRIRPFGFLANCHRAEKLALIRRLLAADQAESEPLPVPKPMEHRGHRCPHCGEPALRLIAETPRPRLKDLVAATYRPSFLDST